VAVSFWTGWALWHLTPSRASYCSYPPHARRALICVALFIKIVSCNNKKYFIVYLQNYFNCSTLEHFKNVRQKQYTKGKNGKKPLLQTKIIYMEQFSPFGLKFLFLFLKQDWRFFHSLSCKKKMSKLSKILFFAILDLQFLTCN
jgi:hypothetical protein